MRRAGTVLIALAEAWLACWPVVVLQGIALLPLVLLGQGREAMWALLDPVGAGAEVAWIVFPLALAYSCVLTAAFAFFLLGPWNYPAAGEARAFCRIWVPGVLALSQGLLWPLAGEQLIAGGTVWDGMLAFTVVSTVFGLTSVAWWTSTSAPDVTSVGGGVALAVICVAVYMVDLQLFCIAALVAQTVFCISVRSSFTDSNSHFTPGAAIYPIGFTFAAMLAGGVLWLSASSVGWRMFLGTPGIVVLGAALLTSLAFLVTGLLSRVSPVLVRVGWLVLAAACLMAPINHEPLRLLPRTTTAAAAKPAPHPHFVNWLRGRIGAAPPTTPYPVFFIAAQGGGIRAAYWTATMLAALEDAHPGFLDHVYVISGVSGGSVGAAVHVALAREYRDDHDRTCAPVRQQPLRGLRACASHLFQWDLLGPPVGALLLNDLPLFWKGTRRARDLEQGLEFAWRATMQNDRFEQPFMDLWPADPHTLPSLVLNTTSADNGLRFVVSNLAAADALTDTRGVDELAEAPLRLSTAALLSARFPLVSPVATLPTSELGRLRLVDGGYFNNSGLASLAKVLEAIAPAIAGEFAGRVTPMVLVLANSPRSPDVVDVNGGGSLLEALVGPVSVLQSTSDAHDDSYRTVVARLVGADHVLQDLRPADGADSVALGWLLSARTRCAMDRMVNDTVNNAAGSTVIGRMLGQAAPVKQTWTSCAVANP